MKDLEATEGQTLLLQLLFSKPEPFNFGKLAKPQTCPRHATNTFRTLTPNKEHLEPRASSTIGTFTMKAGAASAASARKACLPAVQAQEFLMAYWPMLFAVFTMAQP